MTLDEYWKFIKSKGGGVSGLQYLRSRKSKSFRQPKPKLVDSSHPRSRPRLPPPRTHPFINFCTVSADHGGGGPGVDDPRPA